MITRRLAAPHCELSDARSPAALRIISWTRLGSYDVCMRGDEERVVATFANWLDQQGWTVKPEVDFVDVHAVRGNGPTADLDQALAEAKEPR